MVSPIPSGVVSCLVFSLLYKASRFYTPLHFSVREFGGMRGGVTFGLPPIFLLGLTSEQGSVLHTPLHFPVRKDGGREQ